MPAPKLDLKFRLFLRVVALAALCFAAAAAYVLFETDRSARARADWIAEVVAKDLALQQGQSHWIRGRPTSSLICKGSRRRSWRPACASSASWRDSSICITFPRAVASRHLPRDGQRGSLLAFRSILARGGLGLHGWRERSGAILHLCGRLAREFHRDVGAGLISVAAIRRTDEIEFWW